MIKTTVRAVLIAGAIAFPLQTCNGAATPDG